MNHLTHVLWSCSGATDVWASKKSHVQKCSSIERDMLELWSEWTSKLSQEELEVVAVVLRRIWPRRNGMVFENRFEGPEVVFNQAIDCLEEFQPKF